MVWRPRVHSQLLTKLNPSLRFLEKVSPFAFNPHCVGCNPKGASNLITGSDTEPSTAGKLTPRKEFNSLLISPIQPKPAVTTRLLLRAFEYVRKNPVPR